MVDFDNVRSSNIYAKMDLPAALRDERVRLAVEIARHDGEEVARLGERVNPNGKMAAIRQISAREKISVAQKHRVGRLVCFDSAGELGHDVGAVEEVGDAPEALGLALSAQHSVGRVETLEQSVILGTNAHNDAHFPLWGRGESGGRDCEAVLGEGVAASGNFASIDRKIDQFNVFAPVQIHALGRYTGSCISGRPDHRVGDNCCPALADNKIKVKGRHGHRHRLVIQPELRLRGHFVK